MWPEQNSVSLVCAVAGCKTEDTNDLAGIQWYSRVMEINHCPASILFICFLYNSTIFCK